MEDTCLYTHHEEKKLEFDGQNDDENEMGSFRLSDERKGFTKESARVGTSPDYSDGNHHLDYDDKDSSLSIDSTRLKTYQQQRVQTSTNKKKHGILGHIVRTLLLDIPLLLVLLTYAGIVWFSHVHDTYLVPQFKALPFTTERSLHDLTYYTRECSVDDMSTLRGADLFLPVDATPTDAYRHHLKHGFTVFQRILKPETCENLRNFIVKRNQEITPEESIFVIEGANRFSFGLGTEEVSVRNALMEVGNSMRLRPSLEAILGPDPALIELTAITSRNGAVAQYWHDDVVARGSPVQFGRAFGPSYSVFIQLQNTTKEMGATSCCPGTHFCAQGSMEQFCNDNGFQSVNDNGYWGQGDALLMNMNSWHRGGAHTDPDGPDRVMLIFTFVPKPIERAESRQLSQGITFSLRWDMWGHTLNDLANAERAMTQPWTTLRALGLYKPKSASWGIDYISSASIRAANEDNGFNSDDLDEFMSRGGFRFLPKWLQNLDINWDADESWPEFIRGTKGKCESFFLKFSKGAVTTYLVAFLIFAAFAEKKRRALAIGAVLIRVILMMSLTSLLFFSAKSHVDHTGWAKDIIAGRRYTSTVDIDRRFAKERLGPLTYPTVHDVLIETRHGSKQLAIYNDFITLGHPGNAMFREMIDIATPVYGDYNEEFKQATVEYVSDGIFSNQGRFLYQGPDGIWMWLYDDDAFAYVREVLSIAANKFYALVAQNARFIASAYKYGKLRNTALSTRHAVPYIEDLRKKILAKNTIGESQVHSPKPKNSQLIKSVYTKLLFFDNRSRRKQMPPLQRQVEYLEPFIGAWISEEDEVETYDDGFWYYATVVVATGRGDYQVKYVDGKVAVVDMYSIQPFMAYHIGERLHCFIQGKGIFELCTIQNVSRNGMHYIVKIERIGKEINLRLGFLRRNGERLRAKYQFKGPNYHND